MTIKDQIRQIAKEVLITEGSSTKYRLGTVSSLNKDGTANVMVDGGAYQASPLYPVVKGQQVALIFAQGAISAVPTRPATKQVEFEHPPFFTGGVLRFMVRNLIQDAFNANVYEILAPDLLGYTARGWNLSPDGTRAVVIWAKNNANDVHYRVYTLGGGSLGGSITDPTVPLYISDAPLLFEIVRTQDFSAGVGIHRTLAETNGVSWISALSNDPKQLYWVEHEYIPDVVSPANGDIVEIIHFYKLSPAMNPLQTGQWDIVFLNVGPITLLYRMLFYFGLAGVSSFPVNDLFPQFTSSTSIFDSDSSELFGIYSTPFGNSTVQNNGTPNFPSGVNAYSIMSASGASYTANAYGSPDSVPSIVIPNGPTILFSGTSRFSYSSPTPSGFPVYNPCKTKNFNSMMCFGDSDPSPKVIYEDAKTLVKKEGVFTNLLTETYDGFQVLRGSCSFLMTSVSSGYLVDGRGRVRKVTSTDNGLTFTAETDIAQFLKVSPGKPDPTLLNIAGGFIRGSGIVGIST